MPVHACDAEICIGSDFTKKIDFNLRLFPVVIRVMVIPAAIVVAYPPVFAGERKKVEIQIQAVKVTGENRDCP